MVKTPQRPEGAGCRTKAVSQLREILHLHNNPAIFTDIQRNIKLIGRKHLRIEDTPSSQPEALQTIRKEIQAKYPEIFEDQDAERLLYLAESIVMHTHRLDRCLVKKRTERTKRNTTGSAERGETPSKKRPNSAQPTASTPAMKKEKKTASTSSDGQYKYWDILVPTRFNSEGAQASASQSGTSSRGRGPTTPHRPASPASCPARVQTTPYSTTSQGPMTPKPPPRRAPSSTWSRRTRESRGLETPGCCTSTRASSPNSLPFDVAYDAVYHFLDGCFPSMARLWEDFIEYGCEDEEYLLAVSNWPPDIINSFLTRFADNSQEPMTKMDVEVLQAHFLTYFKA